MKTDWKRQKGIASPKAAWCAHFLIIASLAGCASTTIYENGQRVLTTQADAAEVTFATPRSSLHITGLNHSNATLAGGESASQVITSVAGLAGAVGTAIMTSGVAARHPTTAVIGATVPSTISVAKPWRLTVVQRSMLRWPLQGTLLRAFAQLAPMRGPQSSGRYAEPA
jgi:hypothetical protein